MNLKKSKSRALILAALMVFFFIFAMAINTKIGRDKSISTNKNVCDGVDYSYVYDYIYYGQKYPDIAGKYENDKYKMLVYFINYGMSEGQQASENFDVFAYRSNYSDLRQTFGMDLKKYYIHYINYGYNEGRTATGSTSVYNEEDYTLVFDYDYYIEKYPNVFMLCKGHRDLILEYFVDYGMAEGQQGNESFEVQKYLENNPDLQSVYGDDLKSYYFHYMQYGYNEGRKG